MGKLFVISNRLPVTVEKTATGFDFHHSAGGVATGLASLSNKESMLWQGWPGIASDGLAKNDTASIAEELGKKGCIPVWMSTKEVNNFYFGFCNKTIWPLFHYFSQYVIFDEKFWRSYIDINCRFCSEIIKSAQDEDTIWVHDYQLMLLPQMLREKLPNAKIGFFLHIPFPSYELLRLMPWRREILDGLLGADLVGFHEYDYVRHFLSSVYRIVGIEHNLSQFRINDRIVAVDAFPMGIDYDKFANSNQVPAVQEEKKKLESWLPKDRKLILSVDRLDYTKGIINRLKAYSVFLKKNPEYHRKVTLILVAAPSRTSVDQYQKLKEQTEKLVGKINGEIGAIDWNPIVYLYRSFDFEQLAALYRYCDVALITPLRDGMNLVAKEFVACQQNSENQGILVLSEMAGAAGELAEAIRINPYDINQVVGAIETALKMPPQEVAGRNRMMQSRLRRYTAARWANDFLYSLDNTYRQKIVMAKFLTDKIAAQILTVYQQSKNRLLLLDYDGTLADLKPLPAQAAPDEEILHLLRTLQADEKNEIVIITGRDRDTIEKWLGFLPVNLVAEHGAFVRDKAGSWKQQVPQADEWKAAIRPIMELYMDRTPRAFIEEKTFSLVWHCRNSEPDLAKLRTQELKDALSAITANLQIGIFEGSRIVEVKHLAANKGMSSSTWCSVCDWQFILAAGDDYTDEDIFAAVPEKTYTIKVGMSATKAKYRVASAHRLREFLGRLCGAKVNE